MPYKDTPEGREQSRANQRRYRERHRERLLAASRTKQRDQRWAMRPDPPDLPGEEWRTPAGFEGWYEVSNLGRVRSWWSRGIERHRDRFILLKPSVATIGYLVINLYAAPGERQRHYVHRLVAQAFLAPPPSPAHKEVNHIDGCKTNAAAANLEWVTPSGNMRHAVAVGIHQLKLTNAQRAEIRALAGVRSARSLAREYGVSDWMIGTIFRS